MERDISQTKRVNFKYNKYITKIHTKIDEEPKNRLNILKSIVKKMEELVVELTINLDNSGRKTNAEELKELLADMQKIIDSVKEYD